MKGDFARVTFSPALNYSQVLQQQGRVLLEADWNEQSSIQLFLLRALAKDLIGACWAAGTGFSLTTSSTDAKGVVKNLPLTDWQLSPGHFYVDGILCINDAVNTLATQPQMPTPDYGLGDGKTGFENPPASFALWLDVWERHLCSVEAPSLSDVALNGIDTASRAQVVWQLRMLSQAWADQRLDDITAALNVRLNATTSATDSAALKQQILDVGTLRSGLDGNANGDANACTLLRQLLGAGDHYAAPLMTAQLTPAATDSDPCIIAADARYRGCENQLYRVEIHQAGLASSASAATSTSFKWSRENGSVVFAILTSAPGATADDGSSQMTVTLARLGRDVRLGLAVDDWVELIDDDYTLAQRALPLLQVIAVDVSSCSVTLGVPKGVTPYQPSSDARKHPLLRRWDQQDAVNVQGVVVLTEGASFELEDGIQISFSPGGLYATGDYWLIPARVSGSGLLDWPLATAPGSNPAAAAALPARGRHHYAVLGSSDANGSYVECCCRFDSLCNLARFNTNLQPAKTTTAPGTAAKAAAPATKTKKSTAKTHVTPAEKASG